MFMKRNCQSQYRSLLPCVSAQPYSYDDVAILMMVAWLKSDLGFAHFLTHILIGDVIVRSINMASPVAYWLIDSGTNSGSLTHIITESIIFAIMASIVVIRYYLFKKNARRKVRIRSEYANDDGDSLFLFAYHRNLDRLFYPAIVLAIIVSFIYLLFGSGYFLLWSKNSPGIFVLVSLLHTIAIAIILLMWTMAKKTRDSSVLSDQSCCYHNLFIYYSMKKTGRRMKEKS